MAYYVYINLKPYKFIKCTIKKKKNQGLIIHNFKVQRPYIGTKLGVYGLTSDLISNG